MNPLSYTGWRTETEKFEIIRKNEGNLENFDAENVFYKSGNFIIHHFLKNYVSEVLRFVDHIQ